MDNQRPHPPPPSSNNLVYPHTQSPTTYNYPPLPLSQPEYPLTPTTSSFPPAGPGYTQHQYFPSQVPPDRPDLQRSRESSRSNGTRTPGGSKLPAMPVVGGVSLARPAWNIGVERIGRGMKGWNAMQNSSSSEDYAKTLADYFDQLPSPLPAFSFPPHVSTSNSSAPAYVGADVPMGFVRCYWALLIPKNLPTPGSPKHPKGNFELEFIHLDPVLSMHMKTQSLSMLGRGVIEFIHPEERDQARQDLLQSISIDNLEGSVTRVRFARLSRIRTLLGCPPEDQDIPADAHVYVEDEEYLALDLTLHWACSGMLLAFFHAIRDKDTKVNNDVTKQAEGWSNYCGTGAMPEEQIEALWTNVTASIPLPAPSPNPPERVFIIHATENAPVRPNSVIFAWPPPRIRTTPQSSRNNSLSGVNLPNLDSLSHAESNVRGEDQGGDVGLFEAPQGGEEEIPRMDGKYWAEDYADLMKHVELESKTGRGEDDAWGEIGKTSCTRRFQGGHFMFNEGIFRKVESVFIPYGSITFACYQTKEVRSLEEVRPEMVGLGPAGGAAQAVGVGNRGQEQQAYEEGKAVIPEQRPGLGVRGQSSMRSTSYQGVSQPNNSGVAGSEYANGGSTVIGVELDNTWRSTVPDFGVQQYQSQPPQRSISMQGPSGATIPPAGYGIVPNPTNPSGPQAYLPYAQKPFVDPYNQNRGLPSPLPTPALDQRAHYGAAVPHPQQPDWAYVNSGPTLSPSGTSQQYQPQVPGGPAYSDMYRAPHQQAMPMDPNAPFVMPGVPHQHMQRPIAGRAHSSLLAYPVPAPDEYDSGGHGKRHPGEESPEDYTSPESGGGPSVSRKRPARRPNTEDGEPAPAPQGRVAVPPPDGIDACSSCGRKESPEWRKSLSGLKDLCNACGLKLARLQAKKEGRQKPRKRKPTAAATAAA